MKEARNSASQRKVFLQEQGEDSTTTIAENCLNPLCFRDYINNYGKQLATDACYSDETIAAFNSHKCYFDDTVYIYQFVRDVVKNFDGHGEKFYSLYYYSVSGNDIAFNNLNRGCSIILGFEVANSVLGHANSSITSEN